MGKDYTAIYAPKVRVIAAAVARRFHLSADDRDDIAQTLFLRLVKLGNDPRLATTAWAHTVLNNAAIDYLRHHRYVYSHECLTGELDDDNFDPGQTY